MTNEEAVRILEGKEEQDWPEGPEEVLIEGKSPKGTLSDDDALALLSGRPAIVKEAKDVRKEAQATAVDEVEALVEQAKSLESKVQTILEGGNSQ